METQTLSVVRYVTEFAERNKIKPLDTEDRMKTVVIGGVDKRLRFKDLVRGKSNWPSLHEDRDSYAPRATSRLVRSTGRWVVPAQTQS